MFYRFTVVDTDNDASVATISYTESAGDTESTIDLDFVDQLSGQCLNDIALDMKNGLQIKDRMHRLKLYRNCFIGSEAVDYLVQTGIAKSRVAAVAIGRRLQAEMKCFRHVEDDHYFEDAYLFYRFDVGISSVISFNDSISMAISSMTACTNQPQANRLQISNIKTIREKERMYLKNLLEKSKDSTQIVELRGKSGNGKTTLVHSAFSNSDNILFAEAKFDDSSITEPLLTMKQLFLQLCVQAASSLHLTYYLDRLASDDAISELEFQSLLTWEPESSVLLSRVQRLPVGGKVQRSSNAFTDVRNGFQSFLSILSSEESVVLFLDDAECADLESFEFLNFGISIADRNILTCVAYQEGQISYDHPVVTWRNEIMRFYTLENIVLQNLCPDKILQLMCRLLGSEDEDVEALASLIYNRTLGDLLFVTQLLEEMQDSGLLSFCLVTMKWKFSIEDCRSGTQVADNVARLLSSRISQLSRNVEQLLKLVSCFDGQVTFDMIEASKDVLYIFGSLDSTLDEACEEQLLIRSSQRAYKFAHREVQMAAYELLPPGKEKKMIHFDIANALAQNLESSDDSSMLFGATQQFRKAGISTTRRLLRPKDQLKIVNIFILAGKKASLMSAFQPAAEYLKIAVDLLGHDNNEIFQNHHQLAIKLFLLCAKTELNADHIEESRKYIQSVLSHGKSDEHHRAAQLIFLTSYSLQNELENLIKFAIELLDSVGETITECKYKYEKTMKQVLRYSDAELVSLPFMTDSKIEYCVEIICEILNSAIHLPRTKFYESALMQVIDYTLTNGACKHTPFILIKLGQEMIVTLNDLKMGNRFIQLGLRSLHDMNLETKSRVLAHVSVGLGCIEPASRSMYLALDGFETGMKAGSIYTAFNAASWYLLSFYFSGLPIDPLLEDAEKFILQME